MRAKQKTDSRRSTTKPAMRFSAVHLRDAKFTGGGLRDFFAYRDLGIAGATGGRFGATHIRAKQACAEGTGPHRHGLGFQMIYMLKGWAKFDYQGQGVVMLRRGSCAHQPPGIRHELIACSKDCEIIEITAPAAFLTTAA